MERLIRFFVERHLLVNVIVVAILGLGWLQVTRLPRETFPNVTMPKLFVNGVLPGASARDVETKITIPIQEVIEDLDYSEYKDKYVEKLTQVIQAKVEGQEIVTVPDPEEPKILNLMDALKQSVAKAQGGDNGEKGEKKVKRKMSPSSSRKASSRKRKSS